MKLSVSLPDTDVEFLDDYARAQGYASRSAALQHAIRLLRGAELGDDYARAWDEWAANPDAEAWDSTLADGLPPAA